MRPVRLFTFVIVTVSAFTSSAMGAGRIWYVDKDSTSENPDGRSWATAYRTLPYAIRAAWQSGGGEVWVTEGIYDEPRNFTDVTLGDPIGTLVLREDVSLYGGFVGNETRREMRNPIWHHTVIASSRADNGAPSGLVLRGASRAVLNGFTIAGLSAGEITGIWNDHVHDFRIELCTFGSTSQRLLLAMVNESSDVTISRCTFRDTFAPFGGCIQNTFGSLLIEDSLFVDNQMWLRQDGGSLACVMNRDGEMDVRRCLFLNNFGTPLSTGPLLTTASTRILDSDFVGNDGVVNAGAVVAFTRDEDDFRMAGCTFIRNIGQWGIVRLYGNANRPGNGLDFEHSYTVQNCVFANNETLDDPTVVVFDANYRFDHCSFFNNIGWTRSTEGPLIHISDYYGGATNRLMVTNSIFWNPRVETEFFSGQYTHKHPDISYSIVRGGYAGDSITADEPLLASDSPDEFRLTLNSPGVDVAPPGIDIDVLGNARPEGLGPDIGAHEVLLVPEQRFCNAVEKIDTDLSHLRFMSGIYGDIDRDGLPEVAGIHLLAYAACTYNSSLGQAAQRAYEQNLDILDLETFDMRIARNPEVIAALMSIGTSVEMYTRAAFAVEGLNLEMPYASVSCNPENQCIVTNERTADSILGAQSLNAEPFSGQGDFDNDEDSNAQEWTAIVRRGGSLQDYIDAATDPMIRSGSDTSENGGGCLIATAAFGTPLAQQLSPLRAFRDRRLLDNTVGAAFTDAYYRISPIIAGQIAEHPPLKNAVRWLLAPLVNFSNLATLTFDGSADS